MNEGGTEKYKKEDELRERESAKNKERMVD